MTALIHDKTRDEIRAIKCNSVRVSDNFVTLRFVEHVDEHSIKGWAEPLPAENYRLVGTTY